MARFAPFVKKKPTYSKSGGRAEDFFEKRG